MNRCSTSTCCETWREVGLAYHNGRAVEAVREAKRLMNNALMTACVVGRLVIATMKREGAMPNEKEDERNKLANQVTTLRLQYREKLMRPFEMRHYEELRAIRKQLEQAEAALADFNAKNPINNGKSTH